MERLTKIKEINALGYTEEEKTQIIIKLSKLEDLEEQVGCPLEVRCKLVEGVHIYNALGEYCVINEIYEDSIEVYKLQPVGNDYYIESAYMTYKFSDYKKEWWLKRDRSE